MTKNVKQYEVTKMTVEEFRGYMRGVNEVLNGDAPNKRQWKAIMEKLESVDVLRPVAPLVQPVIIREPRPWYPTWYYTTYNTSESTTYEAKAQQIGAAEMTYLAEGT